MPSWHCCNLHVWFVQDVLAKVSGGAAMTIAEATMIADNALEHTVRSLLAALQAPEILKSTQGMLCLAHHVQGLS